MGNLNLVVLLGKWNGKLSATGWYYWEMSFSSLRINVINFDISIHLCCLVSCTDMGIKQIVICVFTVNHTRFSVGVWRTKKA